MRFSRLIGTNLLCCVRSYRPGRCEGRRTMFDAPFAVLGGDPDRALVAYSLTSIHRCSWCIKRAVTPRCPCEQENRSCRGAEPGCHEGHLADGATRSRSRKPCVL